MQFLQYIFLAMPFVVMLAAALIFCFLSITSYRTTTAALWLVGFWIVFDVFFPSMPLLRIGLLIYLPDLICVLLAFVTVLRLTFAKDRPPLYWSWRIFVCAATMSFALGAVAFGSSAGAAFRPEFYSIITASYVMTFRMDQAHMQRLMTALGWICISLIVVVLFRWLVVTVPITDLLPPGGSYDPMQEASKLRVIGAETALLMGQVFVISLFYASTSKLKSLSWMLVLPLVLAVIGLQHRSVWLAVVVGIVMRYSLPAAGRRGSTQLLMLALVLTTAMLPLIAGGGLSWLVQDVADSAGRALSMTDTAQARMNAWRFGLDKWWDGGVKSWLLGQPIGTSMERVEVVSAIKKIRVGFQVHNNYINMLLHYGVVGLGAMIWLYVAVGQRLYRLASNPVHSPMASALILMLVLQLTFFLTYSVHFMQGLIIGLAAAYTMTVRRESLSIENQQKEPLDKTHRFRFYRTPTYHI